MALGGQTLGLKAKVETELSRSASRQLTRDVEKAIESAEEMSSPGAGGGFASRTMPGGGGGGGVGAAAGGAAAARGGAGGLASKLGAGSLGAGAAVLGTVALGGVLASKLLGAMERASGRLQASTSILGTALDLFFKPFGDYLGRTLMPLSKSLLEASIGLNKNISGDGLVIGGMKSLLDYMNNLPGELGKILVQTMGQHLEALFGSNPLFTAMQDFQWSDFIPIVKWDDVLGSGFDVISDSWPGWPSIKTDWPGWPDFSGFESRLSRVTDALQGVIDWANTLPGVSVETTDESDSDDTDDRGGTGSDDTGGDGSQGSRGGHGQGRARARLEDSRTTGGSADPRGRGRPVVRQSLDVSLHTDKRRLSETNQSERDLLHSRVR